MTRLAVTAGAVAVFVAAVVLGLSAASGLAAQLVDVFGRLP